MKTMIVFLGERKMHCGTKRDKKAMGGRITYGKGGKANTRREPYRKGSKAMSKSMPKCMPN